MENACIRSVTMYRMSTETQNKEKWEREETGRQDAGWPCRAQWGQQEHQPARWALRTKKRASQKSSCTIGKIPTLVLSGQHWTISTNLGGGVEQHVRDGACTWGGGNELPKCFVLSQATRLESRGRNGEMEHFGGEITGIFFSFEKRNVILIWIQGKET